MTSPAIGVTTTQTVKPIMSLDMFKFQRRHGVDLRLVPQGSEIDNDAALARIIQQASDWMFGICLQTLNATLDTVRDHVNINRRGEAVVYPRYRPVIAVTEILMGGDVANLAALSSLANVDVQESSFTVPTGPSLPVMSSAGPLQFGPVVAPLDRALVQYTYVNGYPHAFLTAPAEAGATSIALDDTTGIIEGNTWLTIYAGRSQFRFLAGAVSNAVNGLGFGAGSVTCPALPYAVTNRADYPTLVSAMPGNALTAGELAIRSIIKSSSAGNISAPTAAGGTPQRNPDPLGAGADLAAAEKMLRDGGFIVPVA